jgi:hypothetical protein
VRLTQAPEPGGHGPRKGPRGGLIQTIKTVRNATGLLLKDAKALVDRVRAGHPQELKLLPHMRPQEVLNDLLGYGCSVNLDLDVDARAASREQVAEVNEEALFADGFDDALIGYVQRFSQPPLALYDREKCIQILMAQHECSDECDTLMPERGPCQYAYEEAVEYFEYNTMGAWMGGNTPAFATILHKDEE